MREHVEDHAAAVLGAVVPARSLRGHVVALEDPVAELAAYGQDAPEEPVVDEPLQLEQAGQVDLVVHDTVVTPAASAAATSSSASSTDSASGFSV